MTDGWALVLYVRTHNGVTYVVGTLLALGVLCLSLRTTIALGNLDSTASTPLSASIVMVLGILAGGTWDARAPEQDRLLTGRPTCVRCAHPVVVITVSCVAAAVTMWFYLGAPAGAAVYFRTTLLWCGLGFASAALLRSTLAWVLPMAYLVILANVGYDSHGAPLWWNIPFRAPGAVTAWVGALLVAIWGAAVAIRRR